MRSLRTLQILLAAILAALFAVLLGSCLTKGQDAAFVASPNPAVFTGTMSIDGGEPVPFDKSALPSDGKTHTLTVALRPNKACQPNDMLCLITTHMRVPISIGGKVVYAYGQEGSYPDMFRSAGSVCAQLSLYPLEKEGELVVTLTNLYPSKSADSFAAFFDRLSIGEGGSMIEALWANGSVSIVLGLMLASIGLCALIIALVKRSQALTEAGSIAAYGFFTLTCGLYVFLDGIYPYQSLLIRNPYVFMALDVLCVPLLLTAGTRMFLTTMKNQTARTLTQVACLLSILFGVIATTLQLLSVCDLYEMTTPLTLSCGGVTLMLCVPIVIEWRAGQNRRFRLLMLTLLPLFAVCLMEYINYALPFLPSRKTVPIGIGATALLQLLRLMQANREDKKREQQMQSLRGELIQSRISIMLSQIQPHFLYNALSVIQNLCHDKAPLAEKATIDFAEFLRGNLDSLSAENPIPFEQELHHTKNYLSLEKLRFGERLTVVYDISEDRFALPTLTLQPIVENAVRYGVMRKESGGTVTIAAHKAQDAFIVTVTDDGVGFDPYQPKEDGRTHIGIKNVADRLERQVGGKLTIRSSPGVGTVATLSIPKEAKHESVSH